MRCGAAVGRGVFAAHLGHVDALSCGVVPANCHYLEKRDKGMVVGVERRGLDIVGDHGRELVGDVIYECGLAGVEGTRWGVFGVW